MQKDLFPIWVAPFCLQKGGLHLIDFTIFYFGTGCTETSKKNQITQKGKSKSKFNVCHRYSASSLIAVLLSYARIIGRRATYRYALPDNALPVFQNQDIFGATDKRVFELTRAQSVHSLTVVARIATFTSSSVCHRYSASSLIAVLLSYARIIGRRATYRYALPDNALPDNALPDEVGFFLVEVVINPGHHGWGHRRIGRTGDPVMYPSIPHHR